MCFLQLEEKAAAVSAHQKALDHAKGERNALSRECTAMQGETAEARRKLAALVKPHRVQHSCIHHIHAFLSCVTGLQPLRIVIAKFWTGR